MSPSRRARLARAVVDTVMVRCTLAERCKVTVVAARSCASQVVDQNVGCAHSIECALAHVRPPCARVVRARELISGVLPRLRFRRAEASRISSTSRRSVCHATTRRPSNKRNAHRSTSGRSSPRASPTCVASSAHQTVLTELCAYDPRLAGLRFSLAGRKESLYLYTGEQK